MYVAFLHGAEEAADEELLEMGIARIFIFLDQRPMERFEVFTALGKRQAAPASSRFGRICNSDSRVLWI